MTLLDAVPYAIAGAVALGAGGYWAHCESVKKDREQFISKLQHQAADQERQNNERAGRERKAKEEADAKSKRDLASLHRTIKRLRDERASAGSLVPATAACAGDTSSATFDRTELDRALRNFTEGVSVLIGEGSEAVIHLDQLRDWAQGVQ